MGSYLLCTVGRPLCLTLHTLYKSEKTWLLTEDEALITQTYLSSIRTFPTGKGDLQFLKIWRFMEPQEKWFAYF